LWWKEKRGKKNETNSSSPAGDVQGAGKHAHEGCKVDPNFAGVGLLSAVEEVVAGVEVDDAKTSTFLAVLCKFSSAGGEWMVRRWHRTATE
jgi:hypothetical protein